MNILHWIKAALYGKCSGKNTRELVVGIRGMMETWVGALGLERRRIIVRRKAR
jgi:hypothetical protein